MDYSTNRRAAGFSVVELMVALALSMILAVAVVTVFVNNSHSFSQDENVSRMQDDARHALRELAFEISMAGHFAELLVPSGVQADATLAIGADCGPVGQLNWTYNTVQAGTDTALSITAIDNATSATAMAAHSCFQAGEVADGTDIVSIKRVAGAASTGLRNDTVYLRTNGTQGLLFSAPMPAAPTINVPAPNADWEYRPSIYYIRQFANAPGDGIPTLCRKVLQGAVAGMRTECLATGIEDLQIEYGIDTSLNGQPNVYVTSPTLVEIQNVVSARIFLLARTTEPDVKYTNQKTFSISNSQDYTPDDSFHRRVFSTSVTVQNIRSMNMMSF